MVIRMMQKWMMVALLTVMSSPALGSGSEPFMGLCDNCNSNAQFEVAAENLAPNFAPGDGSIKVYPVYVTNPMTADIRFFHVAVWYDWQGGQPQAGTDSLRTTETYIPVGEGGESVVLGPGLQKLATPGVGNQELEADLYSGSLGLQSFLGSLPSVIDVGDLDWNNPPGSAADLIGPVTGPAGLHHAALANALSAYVNQNWSSTVVVAMDAVDRLYRNYAGESSTIGGRHATIRWANGSSIRFRIDAMTRALGSFTFAVDGEVVQNSFRMPDGSPGPWAPGQFDGFTWEQVTPSTGSSMGIGLIGAAYRTGELNCSFSCVDKHDENVSECVLSCSPN